MDKLILMQHMMLKQSLGVAKWSSQNQMILYEPVRGLGGDPFSSIIQTVSLYQYRSQFGFATGENSAEEFFHLCYSSQ